MLLKQRTPCMLCGLAGPWFSAACHVDPIMMPRLSEANLATTWWSCRCTVHSADFVCSQRQCIQPYHKPLDRGQSKC